MKRTIAQAQAVLASLLSGYWTVTIMIWGPWKAILGPKAPWARLECPNAPDVPLTVVEVELCKFLAKATRLAQVSLRNGEGHRPAGRLMLQRPRAVLTSENIYFSDVRMYCHTVVNSSPLLPPSTVRPYRRQIEGKPSITLGRPYRGVVAITQTWWCAPERKNDLGLGVQCLQTLK